MILIRVMVLPYYRIDWRSQTLFSHPHTPLSASLPLVDTLLNFLTVHGVLYTTGSVDAYVEHIKVCVNLLINLKP